MLENTLAVQELAFAMNELMEADTIGEESIETERFIRAVHALFGVQGDAEVTDFMLYLLVRYVGESEQVRISDAIHDILQEADLRVQVMNGL